MIFLLLIFVKEIIEINCIDEDANDFERQFGHQLINKVSISNCNIGLSHYEIWLNFMLPYCFTGDEWDIFEEIKTDLVLT